MSEKQSISRKKISENISSETLFTFTGKLEYLIGMLRDGIKPRYVFERLPYKEYHYVVPVKCFCDIPLGKIKSHLEWFGNYGLGIKRSFLQDNGTTPIMYVHKKSDRIFNTIDKLTLDELKKMPSLPLLKRNFGWDYKEQENGVYEKEQRKFYDEREWRYVPLETKIEVGKGLTIENGIKYAKEKNINSQLKIKPLKLTPSLIEYIIIYDRKEFEELRKALEDLYNGRNVYEEMLSKILIVKQVLRDF